MEENQMNEQKPNSSKIHIIIPIILTIINIIVLIYNINKVGNSNEMFSGFGALAAIVLFQFILGFIWGFYGFWVIFKVKLSKKYKHSSIISFIICLLITCIIIFGIIIIQNIKNVYFNYTNQKYLESQANIFSGDK